MKVVLDTNIFISGIFWKGSSNKVITNWREEKFTLVTSLEAISEIIKVLKDFKIKLSDEMIKEWVDLIVRNSMIVDPKEKIEAVKDDPKDNIFIETAVVGNADYIISQDNHLLKLKDFGGIKIITPEEFDKICN
ncbi:putative toxin-antitoxin system toxin component, PIN family [Candidatus Woesearchaeota archaeon]|nr:putative toxin-antitoxin system toxin component, PIN family [Candidatus Woesearchaeota archaeon]